MGKIVRVAHAQIDTTVGDLEGNFKKIIWEKLKWTLIGSVLSILIAIYYYYQQKNILFLLLV